jgi:hypothetical protein
MQELLDAIAPGKKDVWEKYLAEGSIYADEEERVLTKDELLKELNPLPKGYVGSIKMGAPKVLVQENIIVLSFYCSFADRVEDLVEKFSVFL